MGAGNASRGSQARRALVKIERFLICRAASAKLRKFATNDGLIAPNSKLKAKDYERELAKLHVELVKPQQWVVKNGPPRFVHDLAESPAPHSWCRRRNPPSLRRHWLWGLTG